MDFVAGQVWALAQGPSIYVHDVTDDVVSYSLEAASSATHQKSVADFKANILRLNGKLETNRE